MELERSNFGKVILNWKWFRSEISAQITVNIILKINYQWNYINNSEKYPFFEWKKIIFFLKLPIVEILSDQRTQLDIPPSNTSACVHRNT